MVGSGCGQMGVGCETSRRTTVDKATGVGKRGLIYPHCGSKGREGSCDQGTSSGNCWELSGSCIPGCTRNHSCLNRAVIESCWLNIKAHTCTGWCRGPHAPPGLIPEPHATCHMWGWCISKHTLEALWTALPTCYLTSVRHQ